jgi:hypothetical protein
MAKSFKYPMLPKAGSLIDSAFYFYIEILRFQQSTGVMFSALNLASRQPYKCLRFRFEIVNSKLVFTAMYMESESGLLWL